MTDTAPFAADRLRGHRGRHRQERHDEAHDAAADGVRKRERAKLKGHPLVPAGKAALVEDAAGLADVCGRLRDAGTFAYDTEFIGENTYHPLLCLVQVATAQEVTLIDPIAVPDLSPLWDLLGDAAVRKILHAGEQDLEPAVRLAGVTPANVLDTQVAAGFCRLPYPASLAKLTEYVTGEVVGGEGVRLGKGLTFTRWDQRPLSKKQLAYAADDVRYLPLIADWIGARLAEDAELKSWAAEACADACRRATTMAGEDPWERVRGIIGLNGREQAVVRRLAVWRDAAAKAEDLPPRLMLKDEVLVNLARRPNVDAGKLAEVRHLPRPVAEKYGGEILTAIAAGREDEAVARRPYEHDEPTLADRFDADAAWALLQTIAHARGIDPNLIASRRDVERLARRLGSGKDAGNHPLLSGWRRVAAGERLASLLRGDDTEVTLRWPGAS